ncbi:GNAT family N-acetyltransferase [Pleomorphomonas sp. NRK KF1]|uniref:GNAT family N-acetyltransferase n=1 Tax=Pleomorphomonas sp. NRK KF1 TaxID=2943000 RepID=UPI002042E631|nr:GNAT family N-acetyltransferase [Pleomorphomonas sp. NRK KF1]MCM5551936.1 GNAT family N-acetyltransferase [Pleomorphomonas sp. NRK KF1]
MSVDDAAEFNRVVGVVARERRYLRFVDAPPMDGTIEFLRESLGAGNPHLAVVVDGKLVGWCDVCRSSFEIESHVGRLGIGLLPAWRGKGLGKALLDTAIAAAERSDFSRIELTVFSDNLRAIALYEASGFICEGTMRAAARFGDEYRDVIQMARLGSALPKPWE